MVVNEPANMDVENSDTYVDCLYSVDYESCLEAVMLLKNSVIGSNKQKTNVIQTGILPRLFQILLDDHCEPELLVETAITLGSLAKGTSENVKSLIDAGIVNILLRGLTHSHAKYVESCARCLRTVLKYPNAPIDALYNEVHVLPRLVNMLNNSPPSTQECVVMIISYACKTKQQQNILCGHGIVEALSSLLCSSVPKVQTPSLKCLTQLCYQDEKVSDIVATYRCGDKTVLDILVVLMGRDKPADVQLASAKCLTYIHRAGALPADNPKVIYKALPTLVRLCQNDVPCEPRIEGAETLAYLTEVDTDLQRIASISDHLIPTLADVLKFHTPPGIKGLNSISKCITREEKEVCHSQDMKQASFKVFASLAANDEEIRKKIIDTDGVMEHTVSGLSDSNDLVRLAAVRCLHSLSRSVQQLRTTFQDHAVWRPLMKLLHNASDDVLTVASSTLCNLLLEFSPSKEWFSTQPILECGAVELLCGLTRREEPSLRLNGVWALMNMAFQADQKIKSQILATLGSDQIFHLLSDPDVNVLMKTLGLLRNLLSTKPHIDHIMSLHGKQVMQAVILILEGDHSAEVKEQALCILANIGDGDFAKNFIMSNEDVLKKLTSYMMHCNVKLQIAATFCISNLIWKDDEGAVERQNKLKELGVQQLLQQLFTTNDTTLFDKVKTALQQFPSQGTP